MPARESDAASRMSEDSLGHTEILLPVVILHWFRTEDISSKSQRGIGILNFI